MTETNGWSDLAAAMRKAADQFDALALTDLKPPNSANLYLAASWSKTDAAQSVPVIDGIAAAFGTTAKTNFEGRGSTRRGEHRAEASVGPLRLKAYAEVPVPPTRAQTLAELRRENDQLRAQLTSAGGTR